MPDVIVIGCGGGGGVVAKELGELGLEVLVLEAGPWHGHPKTDTKGAPRKGGLTPEEDLAWGKTLDEQFNMFELAAGNPVDGFLRWGPADRTRPPWQRHLPDNMYVWQSAGVGGTTQHYLANCPRAYRRAFAGGPSDSSPRETNPFPFTYDELVPYYEKVEETLPILPAASARKENVFYYGAKKADWPYIGAFSGNPGHRTVTTPGYREQQNAILPPVDDLNAKGPHYSYPETVGCTMCGGCFQGCPHPHSGPLTSKAKRSTLVSYVPLALATGRVEIRPNTFVTRIIAEPTLAGTMKIRGVATRDTWTGEVDVIEAPVVVMAAGAIETPRLWLQSGLPDPSGTAGAGMTIHFYDWITGIFPFDVDQHIGQSSAARFDFPGLGGLEVVGVLPAVSLWGNFLFSRAGYNDLREPEKDVPWDSRGRILGERFKRYAGDYTKMLSILVLTDDEVNLARGLDGQPLNGVGLSTGWPPDEHGASPKVTFAGPTAESFRRRDELSKIASTILREAGASVVHRADFPPLILHVHSTMRMGQVTDDAAEALAVKGLFIADNSVLSNGGGGPNPTLTTQAIATRTAERIMRRHFGGA